MSESLAVDTKATSGKISVVIVKDTMGYVAVGLEHYIAAQGDSAKDVMLNFVKTLYAELVLCAQYGYEGLDAIEKAPQEYWDMYEDALGIKDEFIPKSKIAPQEKSLLPKSFALPPSQDFSDMIDYRVAA